MATYERAGLLNGTANKTFYGEDKSAIDEEPALEMKAEQLTRGMLLPSMSFDRTLKGRTTAFIRSNINMKVVDGDSGKIVETPTTCFGDVEFRGAARRSMSKFLRLSNETSPELIYKLMTRYWKMEEPRLLISVTGGAKSFALDPILKRNFTVGLSRIAETPGCWVISGGTNAGVMKHVGDALQGSNSCIGIASWGILSKRDVLQPDPALGNDAFIRSTCSYEIGSWLTEKGAFLDKNHSHFLLVDDGSEGKFGVEIPFRGQLEKHIMSKTYKREKNIQNVPTVLLVLEGGPGTLGTVYSAVAGENPVPVVIVKSSGRAADLLAYALLIADEILASHENGETPSSLDDVFHQDLLVQVNAFLGPSKDGGLGSYKMVVECLKYKDSFTISAVSSQVDIDDAILEALLNDSNIKPYRQLQLSLVWNRADLAREKIFLHMVEWEGDPEELQWIAIMALAMNNVEFVQLLLEYGLSISSFLTNELLEFLYGYRSYDKTSPLRYEFSSKDYIAAERKSGNTPTYRRLVSYEELMDFRHAALPRKAIEDLLDEICVALRQIGTERFIEDLSTRTTNLPASLSKLIANEQLNSTSTLTFQHPFRELFFWAVLNNMQDMAKLFWKHGDEHMVKSLIACHVCDILVTRHENHKDIVLSLQETSNFFRSGGVELLDACYTKDDQATSTLITSEFNQFKQLDILKVAVASENLDFVSHYSVQGLVEDVWIGNMKERDASLIWVTLAWFLPPLVATFEFRTKEEIMRKVKSEEEYEDEMEEETEENEEDDVDGTDDTSILTKTTSLMEEKEKTIIGSQLPLCRKLYEFYTNTPVVKFVSHVLAYVVFLLLFSFTAMTRKKQTMPTPIEWIVIITAFGYLVSEVYQVIQVDAPSFKARLSEWASSMLNIFDAVVLTLFFVAVGIMINGKTRKIGELLYTIDCGLWWLRLLSILAISPTLGPYLVMITKMVGDLTKFMAVLIIVILAYGVTTAAILNPSEKQQANINMLRDPIWHPYFNIYGELFSNSPPEAGETRFGTPIHDKYDEAVVWVLMGLYLLFTNILLLNLLIAVFNERYVEVQAKALEIWKFKRFGLILEYGDRHFLFPPFSLLGHMWIFVNWLYRRCMGLPEVNVSGLKSDISNEQKEELLEFECDCMTKVEKSKFSSITKSVEEMASEIITELDDLKSDMVILKEKVNNPLVTGSPVTGEKE